MNNTRDIQTVMREQVIPEGSSRYGVVIGIEKYHDEKLNLRCARADAQAVYDLMIDPECGMFPEKNVTLLLDGDATRENIRRSLASLKRKVCKNDTVWLYYAGHAAPEDDDFHWVPYDADIDDLFTSGLAREDITRLLNSFKAERVITFLDCCHAAVMGVQKNKTRTVLTAEEMFNAYKGTGFVTLSSSSGQEKSIELTDEGHGAFTWFLLKGLRGAADLEKAGVISLDCLWKYLQGKVAEVSAKAGNTQTPVLIGEHTHNLPLTINPLEAERKKIIADKIHSLIGIDKDKLSTKEAEICLDILRRNPKNSAEKDIAGKFDALMKNKIQISTFKSLIISTLTSAKLPPKSKQNKQHWWYTAENNTDKQISEAELLKLIKSGTVTPGTCIWREGMPEWINAKDCPEFKLAFSTTKSQQKKKEEAEIIIQYREDAKQGIAEAQYNLADYYKNGKGISKNMTEAAKWYRKAAEQGYADAQFELASCHYNGIGVTKYLSEAVKWYRKAAEQGHADAQNSFGDCYKNGEGVSKDLEEAVKWYHEAIDQGSIEGLLKLGNYYNDSKNKDLLEVEKWYKKAAEQGNAEAQWRLGDHYHDIEGRINGTVDENFSLKRVREKDVEALKWYIKSAEQENAIGQCRLAHFYKDAPRYKYNTPEIDKILKIPFKPETREREWDSEAYIFCSSERLKLYSKSSEQGCVEGMVGLGEYYSDSGDENHVEAVKWYRKAIELGSINGLIHLSDCYINGTGVKEDCSAALKLCHKAVEHGSIDGLLALASCYRNGTGVEENFSEALTLYYKAIDQGSVEAMLELGEYYSRNYYEEDEEDEDEEDEDEAEAVKWYRKAAEQGRVDAQYWLGYAYKEGDGATQDFSEAAKWYRKAAEQGLAGEVPTELADCYYKLQNFSEAMKWYRKAAERGDMIGQMGLASGYEYGEGIKKDLKKAVMWCRKAAEQGNLSSQVRIGLFYKNGKGVKKDLKKAVKWFRKCIESAEIDPQLFAYQLSQAQFNLGLCYYMGDGVKEDFKKAAMWMQKSAEQGDTNAQSGLACCYKYGDGVKKDLKKAAMWYCKAAGSGHKYAQYHLGLCYYNGEGVKKDLEEAVKWYKKAAEQGHEEAMEIIEEIDN